MAIVLKSGILTVSKLLYFIPGRDGAVGIELFIVVPLQPFGSRSCHLEFIKIPSDEGSGEYGTRFVDHVSFVVAA